MFRNIEQIKSIPEGTEYATSEVGYYNFWYPSDDIGSLDVTISGVALHWRGGADRWVAYQVTAEVAKKYGSPIRVLWFSKEDLKNG